MFTLHVSWLLVACVPGLLMLTAFGLGRLERDLPLRPLRPLRQPAAGATDQPAEPAEAIDMHTLAREGMPEALEYLHRRREQRELRAPPAGARGGPRHAAPTPATDFSGVGESVFPTSRHTEPHGNPRVGTPRDVNRV